METDNDKKLKNLLDELNDDDEPVQTFNRSK